MGSLSIPLFTSAIPFCKESVILLLVLSHHDEGSKSAAFVEIPHGKGLPDMGHATSVGTPCVIMNSWLVRFRIIFGPMRSWLELSSNIPSRIRYRHWHGHNSASSTTLAYSLILVRHCGIKHRGGCQSLFPEPISCIKAYIVVTSGSDMLGQMGGKEVCLWGVRKVLNLLKYHKYHVEIQLHRSFSDLDSKPATMLSHPCRCSTCSVVCLC